MVLVLEGEKGGEGGTIWHENHLSKSSEIENLGGLCGSDKDVS